MGKRPGTYTWIPFGGGIRRCIGASVALAAKRAGAQVVGWDPDAAALAAGLDGIVRGAKPPPIVTGADAVTSKPRSASSRAI